MNKIHTSLQEGLAIRRKDLEKAAVEREKKETERQNKIRITHDMAYNWWL